MCPLEACFKRLCPQLVLLEGGRTFQRIWLVMGGKGCPQMELWEPTSFPSLDLMGGLYPLHDSNTMCRSTTGPKASGHQLWMKPLKQSHFWYCYSDSKLTNIEHKKTKCPTLSKCANWYCQRGKWAHEEDKAGYYWEGQSQKKRILRSSQYVSSKNISIEGLDYCWINIPKSLIKWEKIMPALMGEASYGPFPRWRAINGCWKKESSFSPGMSPGYQNPSDQP